MSVVNKVVVKNVAYDIEDANTKQALSKEVTRAQAKEQELEGNLENVQNKLNTTATELLKRIQGTSDNSSASNDPFKRYPTNFSSVADAEFMEALNTMHSTVVADGYEGHWRLYLGEKTDVEVKNVCLYYKNDIWVQAIKLPYKWYKSSNKFGIDDDGNYHIHTYYRIHKDDVWGEWIEVEEELKSAITNEENRAKAEEAAIRKLITDLIGESPETLDSIHEISSWILNDKTGAAAMAKAISENKTAIESEATRAQEAESGLSDAIRLNYEDIVNLRDNVEKNAMQYDTLGVGLYKDKATVYGRSLDGTPCEVDFPAATTETAGVMTAEDKVALDTATSRALRALFVAAGAEYNDTDSVIEKTAPWGTEETWVKNDDGTYTYTETPAIVQHLPKHYYLNGLGDITEEQMMKIYNAPHYAMYEDAYANLDIRTTLHKRSSGYAGGNFSGLCALSNIETFGIGNATIYTTSANAMFVGCRRLKHCNSILSPDNGQVNNTANHCNELITLKVKGLKGNIILSVSPKISKVSILYIIQNASPTSAITITLHPDAYARIANQPDILSALEAQPLVTLVSA